jgi:hypothetical protein
MDLASRLVIAAVPLICIIYFIVSRSLNKNVVAPRDSASSLVVLSAMVAALAILIPLGATLLPEKHFSWTGWLLVGALLSGVVSMFGTIYCMISLQGKAQFVPKDRPYIPCWINATWFALALMAFSCVTIKVIPAKGETASKEKAQARFIIAHELPKLGATKQAVETGWGMPTHEGESELVYSTMDGAIVFCLDPGKVTQSIIETKESDTDALRTHCK